MEQEWYKTVIGSWSTSKKEQDGSFESPWTTSCATRDQRTQDGWYIGDFGDRFKLKNGKCHNDNGPAVVFPDGTEEWYLNGKRYFSTYSDDDDNDNLKGFIDWYRNRER